MMLDNDAWTKWGQEQREMTVWQNWKNRARALKKEVYALYLAFRDPRTPWYGKAFAALVVTYAFSPIDLIPDFIPVLGYLDDLVLVKLGVVIALHMIPSQVMVDARTQAEEAVRAGKPFSRIGALVNGAIWVALAVLGIRWIWRFLQIAF
jgi:uncharacterized membrane protein YkvA (DUF1232 family)